MLERAVKREGMHRAEALGVPAVDPGLQRVVDRLIHVARDGLPRMYRKEKRQFAFRCRRVHNGQLEISGESLRYGCITVLGAMHLEEGVQRSIFGGETAWEYCGRMLAKLRSVSSLGDVALLTWAAAELHHPDLGAAIQRLRELSGSSFACDTIEAAWVLSALIAAHDQAEVEAELTEAHMRLIGCFSHGAGLFPHFVKIRSAPAIRSHLTCFADQVYAIQALARYHRSVGHERSLAVAARCAEQICRQQGKGGQWWWHYDARSGSVIEGYPVYSVHQDAMAPMALLELAKAGGGDYVDAICLGLSWMERSPEIGGSLIDQELPLIWRKVGRTDPWKLVRASRAAASRVHPTLGLRWMNSIFRPTRIDFECRPYHLGWILFTWLTK